MDDNSNKGFKIGIIFPLGIAFTLFLGIFLADWYHTKTNQPSYLINRFQSEVFELESELGNASLAILNRFDSLKISNSKFQHLGATDDKKEHDYSVFIFYRDSLISWNSNREIFPTGSIETLNVGFHGIQLSNGWFCLYKQKIGLYSIVLTSLIKNEYSVQNAYLRNQFSPGFSFLNNASLSAEKLKYSVFSTSGKHIVSVDFRSEGDIGSAGLKHVISGYSLLSEFLFLLAFLLAMFFLVIFICDVHRKIHFFQSRQILTGIIIVAEIVVLRSLQFFMKFPEPLCKLELFSPAFYSYSAFLPSIGDYVINAFLLFLCGWLVVKTGFKPTVKFTRKGLLFVQYQLSLMIVFSLFFICGYLINNLIVNSSFSLNFQNIADLVPSSLYGLIIVTILFGALLLYSRSMLDIMFTTSLKLKWLIMGLSIAAICYLSVFFIFGIEPDYANLLMVVGYVVIQWYVKRGFMQQITVQHILFLVLFYALLGTVYLNRANAFRETGKVNLMAVKLSTRQNPLTEDRYDQIAEQLNSDSVIRKYVQNEVRGTRLSDSLNNYLKRTYFHGYWRRYSIQITNCEAGRELLVQPQGYYIDCRKYFQDLITNYGHPATNSNLYYLDYGFGREYYLAVLTFPATNGSEVEQVKIYIEFILNSSVTDPGYPGLLMDQDHNKIPDLDDYSYAIYQHNRLAYSVGPVTYPIEMVTRTDSLAPKPVYLENDIWHYHFKISNGSDLLISKSKNGLLSLITPFSYLFILFAITAMFVAGINLLRHGIRFSTVDLRTKLQLSSSGILILTMLIIGIVQVFYIININGKKNRDYLREKSYSVLTEVQHKFGRAGTVAELTAMQPENFLIKLSNVFFTDINLYDSNGTMISSSRREIFQKDLVAERMDPLAFRKMAVEQNSLFIHDEEIGTMTFGSAYVPMYNEQGKILVYLNLPYFARQDELKKEISSLLVTFGNIYILLILFGSLITFIISNYITSPLSLLSGKMGRLRLGTTNEKIVWKTDDEIGKLVAGYNQMVDDLEKSATQLALTEREGAWREMARQVAHEIKNPLTPMKLSAQYLQKSWNDHAPDMDQRITRFTQTLVNQIDTLAEIASGFSDFAKMPAPQPELIDLVEVVKTVLTWYPDSTGISYVLETAMVNAEIWADRSQLIRVVSNLINNAVQAIGSKPEGLVIVRITESQQQIILEISDNGTGIMPERASKIFQPDFTTKTGGMGLGLSIVKAIIVEMRGEISFTSKVDSGTTFIIKLPLNGQSTHEKKT